MRVYIADANQIYLSLIAEVEEIIMKRPRFPSYTFLAVRQEIETIDLLPSVDIDTDDDEDEYENKVDLEDERSDVLLLFTILCCVLLYIFFYISSNRSLQ
jgi:hypothetical protein